tara:strand:- start:614 stop:1375 length:762 start_codon:yes stop_codon:yes gene_type:complete
MEDVKKIKQEGFYLSTPEYALMLHISTEALRSRRRRGELEGEYKYDGEKYWWRSLRPITVKKIRNDHLKVVSSKSRVSRSRRRGAHRKFLETRYPNHAFEQHNEIKLLASLKESLPKGVIDEITPEAVKVARDNLGKRHEKEHIKQYGPGYIKNYGGPLSRYDWKHQDDLENRRRDYQYELEQQRKSDTSFFLNSSYSFGRGGAYNLTEHDPGAVEIEAREPGPGDTNIERQPISKVQESILRLEIEELKKNK